jgi:Glycoside-hydrolase family GH114
MRSLVAIAVTTAVSVAVLETGAGGSPAADRNTADQRATGQRVELPPRNAHWDYQIGGAFRPAPRVRIVSRDREARPSGRAYNICYVNAYQTQPNERRFWTQHPRRWRLVLKDRRGRPVVDGAWGEFVLDTRTRPKRAALARIVGRWIRGCARDGFDAVEFDNLDSWNRSKRLLTKADNVAFARRITARAHRAGLAAAQKNWAGLSRRGHRIGFDFAIAEECARWRECGAYARAYRGRVLVVEYRRADFRRACRNWGDRLSIVRRDLDVTPKGVNRRC